MNFDQACILSRIFLDLPHQLWEIQATSSWGIFATRLLHNKATVLLNNLSRCYVTSFSPEYVGATFSIMGLALFLAGLYLLVKNKKWLWLVAISLTPLPLLFEFPQNSLLRPAFLFAGQFFIILSAIWFMIEKDKPS